MKINKDSLNARTLMLPVVRKTHLFLIGCGGNGSWLAPPHGPHRETPRRAPGGGLRDILGLRHRGGKEHLPPKLLQRGNRHEQGRGAGASLRAGLGCPHPGGGRAIFRQAQRVEQKPGALLPLGQECSLCDLCGSKAARQEVAKVCKNYPVWWIDTGNLKKSGQVSVGRELFDREPSPFRLPSVTTWTPSPALQFPHVMKVEKEDIQPVEYTKMSCAELALVDEQGVSINHSIASAAASLLAKMLLTKDLRYHCAYVSLEAGTQFVYNSPRILKRHLKNSRETILSDDLVP